MTVPDLRDPPGDRGLPLVGHTFDVLSGKYYNSRKRYDRYGPVSRMRVFGRESISVIGPDAISVVLQNRDRAFANGPGWSFLIGAFFERGLMLLDFEEHHRHRRIMQEAFTADRLESYVGPMNDTITAGLAAGWHTQHDFRFYPAIKQLTLDIAMRTFIGADLGPAADALNRAFVACVRGGTAVVRFPVPGLRWSRGLAGRRALERFLRPRIAAKRAADDPDLLSALVHARADDGAMFTDDDIVNHMIFLLMAAHDTTTITMTTMAYYLAKHSQWQEACRAESVAVGRPTLRFRDLDRLETLDRVMRECMRLVTAVPALARQTTKDTDILGHRLRAGTFVSVNVQATHHLSEYWPDPERFDPDRFGTDATVARNAWIPFGNGVHKCIGLHFGGLEVKAVMHQLLLGHRWQVARDYDMPIDWTSLPRPKDGLPVRLTRI